MKHGNLACLYQNKLITIQVRLTRVFYLITKFSRFCTSRQKHKLPSIVRMSPRTIRCKYTKILELQRFLKLFFAKQIPFLDCFVPRSDEKPCNDGRDYSPNKSSIPNTPVFPTRNSAAAMAPKAKPWRL